MARKTLSSVVGAGGGLKPPTSLTVRECASNTVGGWEFHTGTALNYTGLQETAKINSSTLTSVIDITGSGVITCLGMIQGPTAGSVLNPKIKIIVDGVTVLDVTTSNIVAGEEFWAVVGWLQAEGSTPDHFNQGFGALVFNESINVLIAGDGTDGVTVFWDRYLT